MDRVIVGTEIEAYLERVTPRRDPVLAEMEDLARRERFPIVGPQVGRLFFVLARAAGAKRVFEMGSGFGYSTAWFAQAVGAGGEVVHTDGDPANTERARGFLGRAGLADRVRFETGDARRLLAGHAGPFDVIFCDIDKDGYPEVPGIAVPRLRPGGLLIFDNALWSGRILDDDGGDAETRGVRELNDVLRLRDDLLTSIVPLRDGVSVSVRL